MMKRTRMKAILSLMTVMVLSASLFTSPVMALDYNGDITPMKKLEIEKLFGLNSYIDDEGNDVYETGVGVHADPEVFKKNFILSIDQKKQTIQEIEKLVSENTTPDMSDLEKYYRLAIESNKRVTYDWDFWSGRYVFDYYSHQWDSYGALFEKSICAGIAIFYSHVCHAAGLPCWFVRIDPKAVDHTIDFIPDINGNAYYIDVTENMFFMSDKANPFKPVDKAFSHITKENTDVIECTDSTFNYQGSEDDPDSLEPLSIKECYDMEFDDWFRRYALHEGVEETFPTDYVERGSGLRSTEPGYHHAAYKDFHSNYVEKGKADVWFLDDFYEEPEVMKGKIINKEFDEALVDVSGVKKNYDCSSKSELENIIARDLSDNSISAEYFPSCEDGKVVAKSAGLRNGEDFTITCTDFDAGARKAVLTVTGKGGYSGSYQINVKLNSAVVAKAPASRRELKYTGKAQALIEEGEADGGVMLYALGTKDEPTEDFTETVPAETNAGKYYVWYKVAGTDGHEDTKPELIKPIASIDPISVIMTVDNTMKIRTGETAKITPELDNAKVQVKYEFVSEDSDIATVDDDGVVTGVKGGITSIYVNASVRQDDPNYDVEGFGLVTVEVKEPFDLRETKIRFVKSSFTYNGKVQKPKIKTIKGWKLKAGKDYTVKWSNKSSRNAGTYKVIVRGKGDYKGWTDATYRIRKAANPMTLKAKTAGVRYNELRRKDVSVSQAAAFTVSKAKGRRSYKLVSAKSGYRNVKSWFAVNAKTGKITLKRGLSKGNYDVKIKVKAKGTANYKASSWKTVTVKVQVR